MFRSLTKALTRARESDVAPRPKTAEALAAIESMGGLDDVVQAAEPVGATRLDVVNNLDPNQPPGVLRIKFRNAPSLQAMTIRHSLALHFTVAVGSQTQRTETQKHWDGHSPFLDCCINLWVDAHTPALMRFAAVADDGEDRGNELVCLLFMPDIP